MMKVGMSVGKNISNSWRSKYVEGEVWKSLEEVYYGGQVEEVVDNKQETI